MKKALISIGIIIGVLILVIAISVGTIWSHRNTAVKLEERIEAQYVSNQSNYDNMWKKFKEMTQVTDLQAEQIKDVYTGLIAGRYDDQGLLFKMVQEQNPQLDTSVYSQLQREISAGRQQFDNNQKQITDIIREYNTYIKVHFIMASITQRTIYDMNKYVITSEQTQDAFKTKKADVIDLK
ncbi:hypothetical protein [Paenibacillus sp. 1781tsa1]|uniref:hypothetical protein n=1 Tax=Paenibacillus sp. 1781tsa1 TaxID=2953810 RepID=UPI0020A0EF69|nr:hypothetical protein [Paenibacillus sp. 1781tsa1]MCP1184939.1 hypothetical protein [Paenibacillus sp. 1781tsa1]